MKRLILSTVFIGLFSTLTIAQEKKWTIQECIDHALENNLELKRSDVGLDITRAQLDQNQKAVYPVLNSNMSHAYNFGRSIDPFTNQFETQSVQSNSFNLTSSVTVFNAYKRKNNIRSSMNDLAVNKEDRNTLINSVSLRVADAFLQILYAHEQLKIAKNQEALSLGQLDIIKKLFDAGKIDRTELASTEAQYSNNQFQVLSATNSIQTAKLNMLQLLQLPYSSEFEIEIPSINIDQERIELTLGEIMDRVLKNFPEMKAAQLRLEGADVNIKIAKADFYPRLSLMANLNTVYSQSRKERINPTDRLAPVGLVEGTNQVVLANFTDYDFVTTGFGNQLTDNFGQSLRFNLSIPIFNGNQVKNNVAINQLGKTRAEISLANTQNQLINDVTMAYTQYLNSQKEYFAAQKNYQTQKETYNLNKTKFDAGLINSSQILVFRSNMDNAEIVLNRIKYQFIFAKLRIVFYQKNTVTLD
jgi:outer membrane protein